MFAVTATAFLRNGPVLMLSRALLVLALGCAQVHAGHTSPAAAERYAGEASLGGDAPIPVHLELRRSEDRVEGTISTGVGPFELVGERRGQEVRASFTGDGGNGTIILRFDDGILDGEFLLGDQPGTLRAERTDVDAVAFFRPPEERLDLGPVEWIEDLDHLAGILETRHGAPFHRTSPALFRAEVERIRAAIPSLEPAAVVVEFRRLAASIGDGHTTVASGAHRPILPIRMFWFEDGVRVVRIVSAHAHLLGARLLAIDGVPVEELVERLRPYAAQGESPWSYRFVAPYLMIEADVLSNAGIGAGHARTLTVETVDGQRRDVVLTATTEAVAESTLGGRPPLWLRHAGDGFRMERLPGGVLYVNWRSYEGLAANATALFEVLDRDAAQCLVIDLRDNGGGDFNQGRDFIRQLATMPGLDHPDRLFVVTGRRTFSAAMTNAVDFRRMTRATLVGEPPGAAPNNWQEVRFFHLPNSGLRVGVSTQYIEFLPGEDAVRPDASVPPVPEDWGSEYDAAVRHVMETRCASVQ
jgi:hypothetical protein